MAFQPRSISYPLFFISPKFPYWVEYPEEGDSVTFKRMSYSIAIIGEGERQAIVKKRRSVPNSHSVFISGPGLIPEIIKAETTSERIDHQWI